LISYIAVQPQSDVIETEFKGNSDESAKRQIEMQAKELTLEAPDVSANEENATVVVMPKDESTKLELQYTDAKDLTKL